jgi:phenylalanyl-tRNA synthetase beta chain
VVEEHVAAGALLATINETGRDKLEKTRPFDEYRGAQVSDGSKSVAFALTFRSPERTLTDAEVDTIMNEIKIALEKKHGAGFRE